MQTRCLVFITGVYTVYSEKKYPLFTPYLLMKSDPIQNVLYTLYTPVIVYIFV